MTDWRVFSAMQRDLSAMIIDVQVVSPPRWKTLDGRRIEKRLIIFKLVNDLVAIPANSFIIYNSTLTRSSHIKQIKQLSMNTDIFKNSFVPRTFKDCLSTLFQRMLWTVKQLRASILSSRVINILCAHSPWISLYSNLREIFSNLHNTSYSLHVSFLL